MQRLPIDDLLPELLESLRRNSSLVLTAPPGAGKTTRLPPALLASGSIAGRILLLQPRRIAARAAASRIATEQKWQLGEQVGYQIRFERRFNERTRILVLTEALLTRQIQRDPELGGVDVVILDEFHLRSIQSDLGLALLREIQRSLRPDLRIIVMSATLDPAQIARYLGDCPVLHAEGRKHALTTSYLKRKPTKPLNQTCAETIERALKTDSREGNILVFLPGAREILRVREALNKGGHCQDTEIVVLHGNISNDAQDQALKRGERRRIILSTNIAETSLTIEDVTVVVDSGLARVLRHDARRGFDHLLTERIPLSSADQRAGRAARTQDGAAYRLWTEEEQVSLPRHLQPEIRRIDLCSTVLEIAAWGTSPLEFEWFEAPIEGAVAAAQRLLIRLGALEETAGQESELERTKITSLGRQLLSIPLNPRLAHMLVSGQERALVDMATTTAALLGERDILLSSRFSTADSHAQSGGAHHGTGPCDVMHRLELLAEAEERGFDPTTLRRLGLDKNAAQALRKVRKQLNGLIVNKLGRPKPNANVKARAKLNREDLLELLFATYPDRLVKRRQEGSNQGLMVGNHGVVLGDESMVREAPFFLALKLGGSGRETIVRLASEIQRDAIPCTTEEKLTFDPAEKRVVASLQHRYLDLVIEEKRCSPNADQAATVLAKAAADDLEAALNFDAGATEWLNRYQSLRTWMPELSLPEMGRKALIELLPSLCEGKVSFQQLKAENLVAWLNGKLDYQQQKHLETYCPTHLTVPSQSRIRLEYGADGQAPILAVRLQEMFGLEKTPTVANGRQNVLLHLLAPNYRPAQVTGDLGSFWRNTYHDVRKELRRRYPKHAWPEDPIAATPIRGAKRRK
jgi:ATP-dependent helicase HrpB